MDNVVFDKGFDGLKDREFALFGAGSGGERIFAYLEMKGYADSVVCFVDSDVQKQGKILLGKKIESIEYLMENPEISVIISSEFTASILNALKTQNCRNEIFLPTELMCTQFFYPNEEKLDADLDHINSLYDLNDEYTASIIKSFFFAQTNDDFCQILPLGKTVSIFSIYGYWNDENTGFLPCESLTMCDAGAYNGDTLTQWLNRYGSSLKRYYGFEPNKDHFIQLGRTVETLGVKDRSLIYPVGLGDQNTTLRFTEDGEGSRVDRRGKTVIKTNRLDDLNIEVIGKLYIKMDIEGFELEALKGAREVIKKYKPNLAICIYHKVNDIHRLPEYIKSLIPDYKCIIRGGAHPVCYAGVGVSL
jgi:FkbM family methyltransferase